MLCLKMSVCKVPKPNKAPVVIRPTLNIAHLVTCWPTDFTVETTVSDDIIDLNPRPTLWLTAGLA